MVPRHRQPVGRGIRERAHAVDPSKHARGPFLGTLQAGPARATRAHGLSDEHQDRGLLYAEKQLWEDAIGEFKKSVEFTPEFAEGLNNLGVCYVYTRRLEEAAVALKEALRHFPGWHVAQANLGLVYQRQKNFDRAAERYRLALGKVRNQPQVWAALGECLEALGKLDEAEEAYRNALSILPKYDFALFRLGLLLARRNELDQAEPNLRAAVELDPELAEAWAVLGAIAARYGQAARARECFEKAKALRPDQVPVAAARGLAALDLSQQRSQALYEELRAAALTGDRPSVAECFFNAGLAHVQARQLEKAHADFLAASEEDEHWVEPRVWAGVLDALHARPAAARLQLEVARKLEPQNALLLEALGTACLALGYPKEAERTYAEARALGRKIPALTTGTPSA